MENLWAVEAPPRTPLGSSQRSLDPIASGDGVAAPPQESHPALGFGLAPPKKKKKKSWSPPCIVIVVVKFVLFVMKLEKVSEVQEVMKFVIVLLSNFISWNPPEDRQTVASVADFFDLVK